MPMGWWLVIAVVMAVIEAGTSGLVTMWFVVGALAAFACAYAGAGFAAQLVVFLAVSVACLVLLRPVILRHRNVGPSAEPSVVGQGARVIERIGAGETGRVETPDHMSWAARSADGKAVEVGETVRIVGQESITLIVERNPA